MTRGRLYRLWRRAASTPPLPPPSPYLAWTYRNQTPLPLSFQTRLTYMPLCAPLPLLPLTHPLGAQLPPVLPLSPRVASFSINATRRQWGGGGHRGEELPCLRLPHGLSHCGGGGAAASLAAGASGPPARHGPGPNSIAPPSPPKRCHRGVVRGRQGRPPPPTGGIGCVFFTLLYSTLGCVHTVHTFRQAG